MNNLSRFIWILINGSSYIFLPFQNKPVKCSMPQMHILVSPFVEPSGSGIPTTTTGGQERKGQSLFRY